MKKPQQMQMPKVSTTQDIEGHGSVPLAGEQPCSIPSAPSKGDMKARGFGQMLRSQMYKVR